MEDTNQDSQSSRQQADPAAKCFVGNLSWGTTNDSLKQAFDQFGNVLTAEVVSDHQTGRSKGFAFVQFATAEEANAAVEAMNGKDLDGRPLTVNIARQKSADDRR